MKPKAGTKPSRKKAEEGQGGDKKRLKSSSGGGGGGGGGGAGDKKGEAGVPFFQNKSTEAVRLGESEMLQQLFGPLQVSTFKQEYFGRTPVHIKGKADRFNGINEAMNDLDVRELLEDTASESISAWVVRSDQGGRIDTVRLQDPAAAYTMYMANHSIYCRSPERVEKVLVAGVVQGLGLGFARSPYVRQAIEGEVELFCTRAGHTTGYHFDFQENVTLQLAGRKRWRMIRSSVAHPVRGCTPHYKKADMPPPEEHGSSIVDAVVEEQLKVHRLTDESFTFGPKEEEDNADVMEVVLEAGDVLYHPAGIWHRVSTLDDEDSISINVSLHGIVWADHLASAFRQLLLKDPAFRMLIGGQPGGQDNEEYLRSLLAKVREEVMPDMTMQALLPECLTTDARMEDDDDEEEAKKYDQKMRENEPVDVSAFPLPYDESHALRLNPLATAIGLAESGAVQVDEEEEQGGLWVVNLLYGDSDFTSTSRVLLRVPSGLQGAITFVTKRKRGSAFKAKDVKGDTEEVQKLLGALLYFGVLQRCCGGGD